MQMPLMAPLLQEEEDTFSEATADRIVTLPALTPLDDSLDCMTSKACSVYCRYMLTLNFLLYVHVSETELPVVSTWWQNRTFILLYVHGGRIDTFWCMYMVVKV